MYSRRLGVCRLLTLRQDELHYGAGRLEGEGVRLGWGGVELSGQLGGAAEEGRGLGRGGMGRPGVDMVEGDGSDWRRRRRRRSDYFVLVEGVA